MRIAKTIVSTFQRDNQDGASCDDAGDIFDDAFDEVCVVLLAFFFFPWKKPVSGPDQVWQRQL